MSSSSSHRISGERSSSRKDLRRRHLLRVEQAVVKFAPLIAAVRQAGGRLGWLDWHPQTSPGVEHERPENASIPSAARAAADAGVLRAVDVGADRVVAVKPLAGPPVLRDVLREHFRGCAAVLVRGDVAMQDVPAHDVPVHDVSLHHVSLPRLEPDGAGGWRVHVGERALHLDTASLVARLRRPRPFGAPDEA